MHWDPGWSMLEFGCIEYWVLPNPDCEVFDYACIIFVEGIGRCDFEVPKAFARLLGLGKLFVWRLCAHVDDVTTLGGFSAVNVPLVGCVIEVDLPFPCGQ